MWPLLLVLAAGAVVFTVTTYGRTAPNPGRNNRRILVWLRGLALGCLVMALGSPFLSRVNVMTERPELLVLVEDSASMNLSAAPTAAQAAGVSRWERALSLCRRLQEVSRANYPPLDAIFVRGNGLLESRDFAPDAGGLTPPAALGTDLDGLVSSSLAQRRGRPVGAVVVISDGCEEDDQPDVDSVPASGRRPGPSTASFHVLGVGDPVGPMDRLISGLRYPRLVHKDDEVVVACTVEQMFHRAAPGDSLTVVLSDQEGTLARKTIADPGGSVPLELSFTPRREGLQVMTLAVSSLGNERFPANNQVSLGVTVRKERSRVLLLDLAPGWDGRFLTQAGLQEPRLRLEVVFPGPQGLVLADSLIPWSWPTTAAGWGEYDGVVLDFAAWPGSVDPVSWQWLAQAVHDGLGLMFLPGPGFREAPTGALPGLPEVISELLPLGSRGLRWREGEFALSVRPGAAGHPVLAGLGSGPGNPGSHWESLPPLHGIIPVTPQEAAVVLLDGRSGSGPAAAALVLGEQGRGRVAWVGGDALWPAAFWKAPGALRTASEQQPGRRLLRNLLVWLGTGEQTGGLRFESELPLASAGRPILLHGSWQDMRGLPLGEGRVILQVVPLTDVGTPGRSFAAGPLDPATGAFTVRVPPLAAGSYTLTLEGQGETSASSGPQTLVVTPSSLEDRQVRQDRRRLVQLAAAGQGTYGDSGDSLQVAALMRDLQQQAWPQQRQTRHSRYDLTRGFPFLALVVLLLGVEWYLRRRFGLL